MKLYNWARKAGGLVCKMVWRSCYGHVIKTHNGGHYYWLWSSIKRSWGQKDRCQFWERLSRTVSSSCHCLSLLVIVYPQCLWRLVFVRPPKQALSSQKSPECIWNGPFFSSDILTPWPHHRAIKALIMAIKYNLACPTGHGQTWSVRPTMPLLPNPSL